MSAHGAIQEENVQRAVYEETDILMPNLLDDSDRTEPVRREDIFAGDGTKGFVLYNVLTKGECDRIMQWGDSVGFSALTGYRADFRNNTRIVANSLDVAQLLWSRIQAYVRDDIQISREKPDRTYGPPVGLEGTWQPLGLNECFRLCRYEGGGHFAPHYDGQFSRSLEEVSFKTFMLYLNADMEGGSTNFISDQATLHKDEELGVFCAREADIVQRLQPQAGMLLVFNHKILHEGGRLISGHKYILRTDVMYTRQAGSEGVRDPKKQKALDYWMQAQAAEMSNDVVAAQEFYRKAFKLDPDLGYM